MLTRCLLVLAAVSAGCDAKMAKTRNDEGDTKTGAETPAESTPSLEPVSADEPLLRALSRVGAKDSTELEQGADKNTFLKISATGEAIAFDYQRWKYSGPSGLELARFQLPADEVAALKAKLATELSFMTLTDSGIEADLAKAWSDYKAQCPGCTDEYAGDVEALMIAYAQDGQRNRVFYASTMYPPQGFTVASFDRLKAARAEVLRLYEAVVDRGTGLLPTAAATANAAAGTTGFVAHDCWYYVEDTAFIEGMDGHPQGFVCNVFAPEDTDKVTPLRRAEMTYDGKAITETKLSKPE